MQLLLHHFLFRQIVEYHAVRFFYLFICIKSTICRAGRRKRNSFSPRLWQTVPLIELCGLRPRREDRSDICVRQYLIHIVWLGIADTAVVRAFDKTALQHIPQRNMMTSEKIFLVCDRLRCRLIEKVCHYTPELILRMRVIVSDLARLGRGDRAEYQDARILIEGGRENMRYQFILHTDLSMISDTLLIRPFRVLSLPYKKKSFGKFAEGLLLAIMLILLSCAERIACRFVIRSRSVTTDFDRLCRTGSAVLIDAGHDRTGDAVTITARFRIVRKRRIDRLVKERRTARLTFLLCHTAANIDPVCIASPCRIM